MQWTPREGGTWNGPQVFIAVPVWVAMVLVYDTFSGPSARLLLNIRTSSPAVQSLHACF